MIAFTGVHTLGQTFMEWSFHFLTGQETYWHYKNDTSALIGDPTTGINAHGHEKNHPENIESTKRFVIKAKQRPMSDVITVIPTVDTQRKKGDTLRCHEEIMQYLKQEGYRIFNITQTRPYPFMYERTGRNQQKVGENLGSLYYTCRFLYGETLDVDPEDTGTMREMISFKILRNRQVWIESCRAFSDRNKDIMDAQFTDVEWTHDTEKSIRKIIDSTSLSIDKDRLRQWLPMMERWQLPFRKMEQRYDQEIPVIVGNIITNKDSDLGPFRLTVMEQALIMAHLMHDHGRRLTLPSNEFPSNTQDLHGMLK